MTSLDHNGTPIPLVGRSAELAMLASMLDDAGAGRGRTLILYGEGGVGKTRLAGAGAEQAARRGWSVALGRGYPVESGVPYALFSDALLPLLRKLEPGALAVLSRGGSAELAHLFPALSTSAERALASRGETTDFKARLLWNFTQFLGRFASKRPLLLVLENLQWADASSLELLHFVARQIASEHVALLCTYNETERDANAALRATEQSLTSLGAARAHRVEPLSREDVDELVRRAFAVDGHRIREFTALLYGWTRGNPFFVEETLKALVDSGRLRHQDGTWLGWELEGLGLPRSIREALVTRLSDLSAGARALADVAAVIGTRASHEVLRAVRGLPEAELLASLDELRARRVLAEAVEGDAVVYDFSHPMLRDAVYQELGRARARLLHGTVAGALESFHGRDALAHADELAYHFTRAANRELASKAVKYLTVAGRAALAKYANREAANYLGAALEQLDSPDPGPRDDAGSVVEELAIARQRLGEYEGAVALWERARADAERAGDAARVAGIERWLGLVCHWSGRLTEALAHYDAGLEIGRGAEAHAIVANLLIDKAAYFQNVGRPRDAEPQVQEALSIAERIGDRALLGRGYVPLLMLYTWTGQPRLARQYGRRVIELAEESSDLSLAWWGHYAQAMLGGLTGHANETARHLAETERLAEQMRSPVHRVWTAEVAIEYLSATGDWDGAVDLAERTISLATAIGQRRLLPRVLVWSAIVYLMRGDLDRGRRYAEEAWRISGAAGGDHPLDVHSIVPAHTGLATYHRTVGNFEEAIRIGELGVAIADRTGYVAWAVHRLLPVIGEAALSLGDLERSERIGRRLRQESERLENPAGIAWASACEGLVAKLRGEQPRAAQLLRAAVEGIEAVPYVADGARLRRQLAALLRDMGDREGAMRELRHAHNVLSKLGAGPELTATRQQMRELGSRPPSRSAGLGAGGLTARETEIIRMVAARKSNKEIGAALGISPRTVSTHLYNIFGKLHVGSRAELADHARGAGLAPS